MDSNKVFESLQEIAQTSATSQKQQLVASFIENEQFRLAVEYAFNPHKVYGIIPEHSWITTNGNAVFDETTYTLLNSLIERKLTGNAARDAIRQELSRLQAESANLLVDIIKKDLRAGFSESTVNKVYKDLIPEYSYMRCSTLTKIKPAKFNWKKGVFSELKLDGMYANGNILDDLQFVSRQGSVMPMEHFQNIANSVKHINGYQTHGELLVKQDGKILPRTTSNGILTSVMKGGKFEDNQVPAYVVWDIIPIEFAKKKGKYKVPYHQRLELLEELFAENPYVDVVEYKVVYSLQEAVQHAMELITLGHEGSVFKDPDMPWEDGTSKWQVKVKIEFESDLEIVEIIPGRVGTKVEGRPAALLCRSSDNALSVSVAVKNDKMRDTIEKDPSDWIGRIVPVVANDLMLPGDNNKLHSLFLPRLSQAVYRIDKSTADDIERIKDSLEAAKQGVVLD